MENIQSFVLKTGYSPLDMKVQVKNDTLRVSFCIYKKDRSISLDDCSKVTLVVRDFLNMLLGKEADFIVDVSSPGADRKLKSWQEFSLFTGKKVRFTRKDEPPIEGTLQSVIEPDKVVFLCDNKEVIVPYGSIVCCQLVL